MDMGTMFAAMLRNLGVKPEMFAQIGATVAAADNKLDRILAQNEQILRLLEGCEIVKAPETIDAAIPGPPMRVIGNGRG